MSQEERPCVTIERGPGYSPSVGEVVPSVYHRPSIHVCVYTHTHTHTHRERERERDTVHSKVVGPVPVL